MWLLLACVEPDPAICTDAPVVTYGNFGQGFLLQRCDGCHAAGTPDRFGAPAEVTFDSVDEVWALRGEILTASTADDAPMPPASPAPAEEREKLTIWLTCAEEGT
jgi:hypothetical protein